MKWRVRIGAVCVVLVVVLGGCVAPLSDGGAGATTPDSQEATPVQAPGVEASDISVGSSPTASSSAAPTLTPEAGDSGAQPSTLEEFDAMVLDAGYQPVTVDGFEASWPKGCEGTFCQDSNYWSSFSIEHRSEDVWFTGLAMGDCGGQTISIRYTNYAPLVVWKCR